MVRLARGAFLVALVAGNLLGNSVAERKKFDLVFVAVKSRFPFYGIAAIENKYIHCLSSSRAAWKGAITKFFLAGAQALCPALPSSINVSRRWVSFFEND